MLFSSITFLYYFLPIVIAVYFMIPERMLRARNITLLIASLVFYSWGEPVYVFLMIYSAIFNYFMGLEIYKKKSAGKGAKRDLIFTVTVNLLILSFFKYFGFLMDTIGNITGMEIHYTALALPIGISFYTFQALSYIFDIYAGKITPQRSPFTFSLYLSFFPQLIAGPIVKYRDIEEQLTERKTTIGGIGEGATRFILGLGKKVLLANNLGALHATVIGLPDDRISVITLWIGMFAYTMQIYFDFSGYSDMAIGLGRMFGFRFNENFNYPYIAKNITDFWRRWHISLSSWFREYLYFPLGGNRVPVGRHILNLVIVWALTGLWHGASWNFVFWGLYYCLLLILEKYVYGAKLEKLGRMPQHLYTMFMVSVGWVFFSSDSLTAAFEYLRNAFFMGGYTLLNMDTVYLFRTNFLLMVLAGIFSIPFARRRLDRIKEKLPVLWFIVVFSILLLSTAYLVYSSYNPFLYFRF